MVWNKKGPSEMNYAVPNLFSIGSIRILDDILLKSLLMGQGSITGHILLWWILFRVWVLASLRGLFCIALFPEIILQMYWTKI